MLELIAEIKRYPKNKATLHVFSKISMKKSNSTQENIALLVILEVHCNKLFLIIFG